jgi:hypothetical protein
MSWAQNPVSHAIPACGKAKVNLPNPKYLTSSEGIIVVEPPAGWVLDKEKGGVFFFVKQGENYENARTLMYIHVEGLAVPFQRAVQADVQDFREKCPEADVQDLARMNLLELGCESKTQLFACHRKKNPYVELVTKVSFNGSLLNVVLSSDASSEISLYKEDYGSLLKHLTMIK